MNKTYASLLAQIVAQAMRVVGGDVSLSVMLQPSLSLFLSLHSHSLTSIGTHPLQPGLSLFLSLGCLSLLCCKAAALSSKVLVALWALSLILCFLNLSSFCSAASDALRALSLSFSSTETCWFQSLQIQKMVLRLNPLIQKTALRLYPYCQAYCKPM